MSRSCLNEVNKCHYFTHYNHCFLDLHLTVHETNMTSVLLKLKLH